MDCGKKNNKKPPLPKAPMLKQIKKMSDVNRISDKQNELEQDLKSKVSKVSQNVERIKHIDTDATNKSKKDTKSEIKVSGECEINMDSSKMVGSTIYEEDLPVIVRRRGCFLRVRITSFTDEDDETEPPLLSAEPTVNVGSSQW